MDTRDELKPLRARGWVGASERSWLLGQWGWDLAFTRDELAEQRDAARDAEALLHPWRWARGHCVIILASPGRWSLCCSPLRSPWVSDLTLEA